MLKKTLTKCYVCAMIMHVRRKGKREGRNPPGGKAMTTKTLSEITGQESGIRRGYPTNSYCVITNWWTDEEQFSVESCIHRVVPDLVQYLVDEGLIENPASVK